MSIEKTKNTLGSSLGHFRETINISMLGSTSLRNGQNALAGSQYFAAAQEFGSASGLFAQGSEKARDAHGGLEQALEDLYPDVLAQSYAATDGVSGYGRTADLLASQAHTLAQLPPQIAAAEAGTYMGHAGATIESIDESVSALASLMQRVESIHDGI